MAAAWPYGLADCRPSFECIICAALYTRLEHAIFIASEVNLQFYINIRIN